MEHFDCKINAFKQINSNPQILEINGKSMKVYYYGFNKFDDDEIIISIDTFVDGYIQLSYDNKENIYYDKKFIVVLTNKNKIYELINFQEDMFWKIKHDEKFNILGNSHYASFDIGSKKYSYVNLQKYIMRLRGKYGYPKIINCIPKPLEIKKSKTICIMTECTTCGEHIEGTYEINKMIEEKDNTIKMLTEKLNSLLEEFSTKEFVRLT